MATYVGWYMHHYAHHHRTKIGVYTRYYHCIGIVVCVVTGCEYRDSPKLPRSNIVRSILVSGPACQMTTSPSSCALEVWSKLCQLGSGDCMPTSRFPYVQPDPVTAVFLAHSQSLISLRGQSGLQRPSSGKRTDLQ